MNDLQKQVVYKQVQDGHITIEELTGSELKELKTHWFDDHYRAMPPIDFDVKVRKEERRREIAAATKPRRMRDKGFFE